MAKEIAQNRTFATIIEIVQLFGQFTHNICFNVACYK